jgi:hypothetical protein
MQTPPQIVTWAEVALDAVKILGPAALALLGSLIALRHQRLLKRQELDAGARLRARELVFTHYQKKLDRVAAAVEEFGRTLGEIEVLLQSPETEGIEKTAANFVATLFSIVLTAKHEVQDAEEELETFGLHQDYQKEMAMMKALKEAPEDFAPDINDPKARENFRNGLLALVLVQEALVQARMKELFQEYLPPRTRRALPAPNRPAAGRQATYTEKGQERRPAAPK